MKPIRLTLLGAPRTKKNHGRLVFADRWRRRRPRLLPSKAHEIWYRAVFGQACRTRMRLIHAGWELPIAEPVNVKALFFRDRATGDAVGYYQALGDLLQGAEIIQDDKLIESWDGSRRLKDAACPRIEVVISLAGGG